MRLAIFGIQWTEINPPSLRLAQSDRLRKEFARFFNFAVVRHQIGGRTTRTCVQVKSVGNTPGQAWPAAEPVPMPATQGSMRLTGEASGCHSGFNAPASDLARLPISAAISASGLFPACSR